MIATLALAFQLAAAAAPASNVLVVRDATRTLRVPLVTTAAGPMVRIDALEPVVKASVHRRAPGEYDVRVFGTEMHFEAGVAVVKVDSQVHPLAAAPMVSHGELLVPLQFVSEVLPTIAPNLRWDARARQLVAFSLPNSGRATAREAAEERAPGDDVPTRAPSHERRSGTATRSAARKVRRTVVVDAGHGGPDNGMTGPIGGEPKVYEKNITLAVAKKLGAELQSRGVRVVYTRTTDTLIALSDRGKIANDADGDLFVSIHVNAANPNWKDPGAARGFETYFLAEARTEDARRVEQMENDAVRFENGPTASKDDPLGFIIGDMLQNEHLRESNELAATIQRHLGQVEPGPSRGVKQAGFRVLVTAYMPAVLVEIGFGTNPEEARFLTTPSKQQEIADAVADGVLEYLQGYERRVSGSGQ